jgi:hypothetical protein
MEDWLNCWTDWQQVSVWVLFFFKGGGDSMEQQKKNGCSTCRDLGTLWERGVIFVALIGRAEFPVPSLWAKLLEEIRLRHSSAEQRPGIADVKNGVPGRSGPGCVWRSSATFAPENTHRGKLSAVTFRKVFGMVVADFGYCSCARLQNVSLRISSISL